MSRSFDHVYEELRETLFRMGGRAEIILDKAIRAFRTRDFDLAAEVEGDDLEIDRLDLEIDREVLNALALQSPVGEELRAVVAVKMTSNELERVGDLARNIAKAAMRLAREPETSFPGEFMDLATSAQHVLRTALDAFCRGDTGLAQTVLDADDAIDAIEDRVILSSLSGIPADPENAAQAVDFILVAKHLERVADHATNIAEHVILMAEARNVKHASKIQ